MLKKLRWKIAQYAERRWWQKYLGGKDPVDYKDWKRRYWREVLSTCQAVAAPTLDMNILDAGCGPAGVFMMFQRNTVTAFDPLINKYYDDHEVFNPAEYPKTKFVEASMENFSSPEKFHRIYCMNAINHVEDIHKSIDNLIQHAASNACIIITIDAHNHSFFKYLFRLLPGDILHPHQYDFEEYKELFTSRGCISLASALLSETFLFDHYLMVFQRKPS